MIAGSLKYFLNNGTDLFFSSGLKGATTVIKGVKSAGKGVLNTIKGTKNIPKNPNLTKPTKVRNDLLSEKVKGLSEANITNSGKTVLGPYPGYIDKAKSKGASYFDVGDAWNELTDAQRWAANKNFLDVVTTKGDEILFSSTKQQIEKAGNFWSLKEIDYLTQKKGYKWVNQWSLKRGEK